MYSYNVIFLWYVYFLYLQGLGDNTTTEASRAIFNKKGKIHVLDHYTLYKKNEHNASKLYR